MKYLAILFSLFTLQLFAQTNPCIGLQPIKLVVLGSSTAAGSGPSSPDSTWVNRYKAYLQSINPSNQVINLAVGGYNTYRIMRTGFTPPPGRPNPDVNKNITTALNHNPDAIIVNMPSNDVSGGFTYQEQMDNYDSIVELANNANVPIWICTTQPKNFASDSIRALQHTLRDSILVRFDPFAINFWDTIALPNDSINPLYDSGDGTHLNDAAHGILASRVIDVDIPSIVTDTLPTPDLLFTAVTPTGFFGCGDSLAQVQVVIANAGNAETNPYYLTTDLVHSPTTNLFTDTVVELSGIDGCSTDTIDLTLNLNESGYYSFDLSLSSAGDTSVSNNSFSSYFESLGQPSITAIHDTLCQADFAELFVQSVGDTVLWYTGLSDTIPVGFGPNFLPGAVNSTTTWYAQSVLGNLYYSDYLETTNSSTINWNGAMLDIVAHEAITIDSFDVKINTTGNQTVEIYTRNGSHLGFETNAAAWNYLGSVTVNVFSNNSFTSVPLGNINVNQNDTLGVYFQLANSSSTLSYRSVPNPIIRSTSEISIITGSGSSHNFGGNYYPRDLNCGVHYHYGTRLEGECATVRTPVTAFVGNLNFDLGQDTIIDILDTLTLSAPAGYNNYQWSTGQTTSSINLPASDLGNGIHYVSVSFTDSLGCFAEDSLIVAIADLVGIDELASDFKVYPNPTNGILNLPITEAEYVIFDFSGKLILQGKSENHTINVNAINPGVYLLQIRRDNRNIVARFIKE